MKQYLDHVETFDSDSQDSDNPLQPLNQMPSKPDLAAVGFKEMDEDYVPVPEDLEFGLKTKAKKKEPRKISQPELMDTYVKNVYIELFNQKEQSKAGRPKVSRPKVTQPKVPKVVPEVAQPKSAQPKAAQPEEGMFSSSLF